MRLGWVKLPGISIFSYSWLQPLERLPSWRTMELTRLIFSLVGSQYQHQAPPTKAKPCLSAAISPLLCFPLACPLFVFFGWTLPRCQQLCQTDWHTPIALERCLSFCYYQIFLPLSPINPFNADIPVCPAKPLGGLETSLLCCCSERSWKDFQNFYSSYKAKMWRLTLKEAGTRVLMLITSGLTAFNGQESMDMFWLW